VALPKLHRGVDEHGQPQPWSGRALAALLALAAGLALPYAFAPTEWVFIAPLSIVILYGAIHARSPRQAAFIGWLFGVGYYGIGVHWVYHSLHIFGGAAEVFAGLLTVVFVLVMTLFPLMTCWLFARLATPRAWLANLWLFAALWVLSELLRNAIMGGFPWILLGYSQTSQLLGELAPVIGVYGIGFVIIVASLSAVEAFLMSQRGDRWLAALTTLAVVLLAVWAGRTEFSESKPNTLAGGFDRDGDESYNAVRQLGGERQMYRKRHIVPFGEYLPLRGFLEIFSAFITVPGSDLSRGDGPHVPLYVAGEGIGVSICYEDVFGEEMRPLLPESTVLVNVSNDAWFGDSAAPHQHEQKARMRAREMARPMVRVTNTGVSSAIRYDGSVIGRIPHGVKGVLDVQVHPRTGTTPYVILGNWPVLVFSLIIVFIGALRRRAPSG